MAIVYKTTDRIKVKIQDVEFEIAPLSYAQKEKVKSYKKREGGEDVLDSEKMLKEAVRLSVKGVKGLENTDGTPYDLKFQNNALTDESLDDLSNIPDISRKLLYVMGSNISDTLKAIEDKKEDKDTDPEVKNDMEDIQVFF